MNFKERIRQNILKQDHSGLMKEFGLTHEQVTDISMQVADGMWAGFKVGVTVALSGVLMLLGLWAVYRGVIR